MNEIKDVVVRNYGELLAAVRPFQPGGSAIREELIRGFDMVKVRKQAWESQVALATSESFGDHKPASMADPDATRFWLDPIIERRMGGRRSGLFVIWTLGDETYTFDPYSGVVSLGASNAGK